MNVISNTNSSASVITLFLNSAPHGRFNNIGESYSRDKSGVARGKKYSAVHLNAKQVRCRKREEACRTKIYAVNQYKNEIWKA
jgi:hypothetical protein